ncbi:cation transporter [Mangrovimonas sp. AS39]|uniref:heavy-metal-associated domain-containing protein n=1 Tax=Mangrovimonas futianensis TaxID=2895523 RepID=UPI001E402795|nr:heavy metal-associated domain-containing protein [Mangrovimonas futianensis]MCF1191141.1 cation transporter [Mangrovimonas futianensis]MCF1194836.1 cation transporter [Mangrovimonas futianensis]
MKNLKHIFSILVVVTFLTSCKDNVSPEVKTVEMETSSEVKELDPNATYAKAEFTIEGMTCAMGCAKTIENKMAHMEGVKSAKVDFDKKLAMVEYDEAKVTPASLEETVKKAGEVYEVKDLKKVDSFSSETMACKPGCTKDCCADKKAEVKETASNDKPMACKEDCKMACCAQKAKA